MERFTKVKAYIDFSEQDEKNIFELKPAFEREGPQIIDRFYAKILETPETRAIITGGLPQIVRLKETFRTWLSQLVDAHFDEQFFEIRSRIGRRHVQVGLPAGYMFAAMNVMRTLLTELIFREFAALPDALRISRSLHKALDLELTIMLATYEEDMLARLLARDREATRDRIAALETTTLSLAHEIGNPLNTLSIHAHLIARTLDRVNLSEGPQLQGWMNTIEESIGRLRRLLGEFREYSMSVRIDPKELDLGTEIERLAAEQAPLAKARGIELLCQVEARPRVIADPDKLQQVFLNLVTNAYEAMASGGRLVLETRHDARQGCAVFSDTGPGIAIEHQKKIFALFYTTKQQGNGLGLAISERIIHALGGRLQLRSALGSGATFEIYLPLA